MSTQSEERDGSSRSGLLRDTTDAATPRSAKGLALTVIATAQMMIILDVSVVNVALPSMQAALGFSSFNLAWVVNAYALTFGGLLLLGGRISDTWGARRTLFFGMALLTVASLAGGMATHQAWLLAARAVQGIAAALVAPAVLSLLSATFTEGPERNKAMGVYGAVSGLGGALGNILGGLFTDALSWRWVLFINVPIGVLVLLTTTRAFQESRTRKGALDLPGAVSATVGMSLIVYGLINSATHPWSSMGTFVPLGVGVILLVSFVVIEGRTREPLMPLKIFANRNRSGAYVIMFGVGVMVAVLFYFLTLFIQGILGFSPIKTGFSFLAFAVGVVITSTMSSRLMDRTGPRPLLLAGTLITAGSMFWLSLLGTDSSYLTDLFGPLLLAGAGTGLCFVPLTLASVAVIAEEEVGIASALLNVGQQVGGALGLAVLATVAASSTSNRLAELVPGGDGSNRPDISEVSSTTRSVADQALSHGYGTGFLILGFIMIGAFILAAVVVRVPKSGKVDNPIIV
ncbi:MFS transporter [Streptomyces tailanensis]|uniref:MFS transporter n=1 Tax=Streptomyces tailanensis TaxID=2569858 RepID=UPI00155AF51B|nr:MFS transporter [Streptomyces tailanensis]